ncbi:tetratricopeptide repeat protein 39B-like [Mya arenaria]|uniref:tetratricopeptide repeat protein 39B-like n=1 Tax=Mya arenaria TaxID=6604 RepID=UPI0022E7A68F|nr:tetratricopeptide repeat protein 39B-like [Mya arenaria]
MATSTKQTDDSDHEEAFEDAVDQLQISRPPDDALSPTDFNSCILDCHAALKMFLNNQFSLAKNRMEPHIDWSMYHALGYGTILYIQAVMTFDMNDIETAIQAIKKSLIVCNKQRRKVGLFGSFSREASKNSYNELTNEEIHAELCYAECLLIRALLTFIQDENLISFVKGGLKIRECYKVYKDCAKILANRRWESESQKHHFESGVKMGVGSFNLMISLLPGKVLKLLEFVGFSGNKQLGLSELEHGSDLFTSLRGPLCSIILIAYHTVVSYVLGLADGDIDMADRLLQPCLQTYPKGALFLFYAGRVAEIRGQIDEAVEKFEESIASQQEWRQFHHLCYWELMWCHCFKGDWLMGMKYAEILCRESRWSKATYTYQKATFLMMCEQTEDSQTHLEYLMGEVPRLKQRIAGKSIPIEKFAVSKAKRFLDQKGYLTLPALELIYTWNGFNIIGTRQDLLQPILLIIETTINKILTNKDDYSHYIDEYCLALLLKGVCQKFRGQFLQAEQCFLEILQNEKRIKVDTYIPPYATLELAILCLDQRRIPEVKKHLEAAKKNYKGYLLESRLHFRIHATRLSLSQMVEEDPVSESLSKDENECPSPPREVTPMSSPVKEVSPLDDGPIPESTVVNGATGIA